jgi:two-component system, cell cycle sensor histidine kinase and response regulator CckA
MPFGILWRSTVLSNDIERWLQEIAELKTENNKLTKALHQSEEAFRKIFHASSNMMAIHTIKEKRFVDLNEAAAALGGFKREDLIGHTMDDRGLVEDPHFEELVGRMLREKGKAHNVETRLRTKNGEWHTILASVDPIIFNNEPCMLAVSIDITEREEKADALRRSEEKYRMLVENSIQGLAILQDSRIVFCNSAYATISGYAMGELLALSRHEVEAMIHPDDRNDVLKHYRDQLSGKPITLRFEHRGLKRDGTVIWLEAHTSIIEYNSKPAIQSVCMDITDRKNAEEALKESKEYLNQIINCIGDLIFVKDCSHRNVLVNDAVCAFRKMSREELIGVVEVLDPARRQFREQEEDVLETGREIIGEDCIVDSEGIARTFMTRKTLLSLKGGSRQVVGVMRDITEYKRLEAQFLQAQKMEAIGVLAGGVAHDFNNLLNVINGYAELILEDLDPNDPMRKEIEPIRDAGQRATTLTSQLLSFGRKQIMQLEIFDVNQVIVNMSSMLCRMIGEDIKIVSKIAQESMRINADPGKIQQIVMNLVVNARDAMPNGGKLTIETANITFDDSYVRDHPMTKPGPYVMIAVSDNGIGMDTATQARIFEPFFTTKPKGKGTGLGMSTVYGIVKQSDGFIWVYSELGKGTTVKIYFPREEGSVSASLLETQSDLVLCGSETVLVVEDEEAVRALTCRVLANNGYNVLEAADGMEALRIAQKNETQIHLVITDVVMPGIGGKILLSRIEDFLPDIKSLFISGYTDNAIVHHGILDSGIAFLQKPFGVDGLLRKVREVLDA